MATGDLMSFNIDGLNKSEDVIKKFQWKTLSLRWADSVKPKLLSEIKRETPFRTGKLRNNTTVSVVSSSNSVRLVFRADGVPYAPYVIHGTRPHKIVPKSAKVLHWTTNGANVFARSVNHPGNKPNNYPERASRRALGDISKAMAEAFSSMQK